MVQVEARKRWAEAIFGALPIVGSPLCLCGRFCMPLHDCEALRCLLALSGAGLCGCQQSLGSYQAGLPEGFVWNLPKPTKAEAETIVPVGGASRLEGHPACCHTTVTNTDFRNIVALLAIIEDVPTFRIFSCTNQQD